MTANLVTRSSYKKTEFLFIRHKQLLAKYLLNAELLPLTVLTILVLSLMNTTFSAKFLLC